MAELSYICAYYTWLEAMEELTDAEKGRLFVALLEYGRSGARPQLRGNERFVFSAIKWAIDRDKEAYAARCRQNQKNRRTVNDGTPSSTTVDERDQDKDKEEEKDKPPEVPRGYFSPELEPVVEEWVAYKREKRQPYKPIGLKNLCATIRNKVEQYGQAPVIQVIRDSMGDNYQGICWSRIKADPQAPPEAQPPKIPEGMRQETGPDGRTRWVRI